MCLSRCHVWVPVAPKPGTLSHARLRVLVFPSSQRALRGLVASSGTLWARDLPGPGVSPRSEQPAFLLAWEQPYLKTKTFLPEVLLIWPIHCGLAPIISLCKMMGNTIC